MPPHSVWPLGRRSSCFSAALYPPPRSPCIVTQKMKPTASAAGRRHRRNDVRPVVRSELPCNLRSLPFGPTRMCPWMRRLGPAMAQAKPHENLNGVTLTARNSHQINPHLPLRGRAAHDFRERRLAKECVGSNRLAKNDCNFPQRRQPRRIEKRKRQPARLTRSEPEKRTKNVQRQRCANPPEKSAST